jgi:plastocyanin
MKTCVRRWCGLLVVLLAIAPATTGVSSQSAAGLRGVARAGGRPSSDTVVWLDAPNVPAPSAPPRALLDQRNLSFSPRVLVVRAGTLVDFPNNDRVFHNVFSFRDGKRFDLGLYPVGTMRRVAFDRPGLSRVFCNIHPNMAAYILTVDSPYFARSDDGGTFTIAGVPAGSHKYHAWRPGAAEELTGTWASADGALSIRWP